MWLVVGLGNPGARYARNRHNIGFQVVDELAAKHGLPAWRTGKLGGDITAGVVTTERGRERCVLLKPMEYMNLSGFAVQKTAAFHDVEVDQIVCIHDEIDLDFATLRVKVGGGHGGHNGLRSMIEQLGGNGFVRVRVGVGKPGPQAGTASGGDPRAGGKDKNVAGWVLADFPSAQQADVDDLINRGASAVEMILGRGATAAMNQLNGSSPAPGARASNPRGQA